MADSTILGLSAASLPLAGTDAIEVVQGTGAGANKRVTLDSVRPKGNATTTDPTAAADNTAGYVVGSRWLNTTTRQWWSCSDASTGAAIWLAMSYNDHPGYVSGRIYSPYVSLVGVTGVITLNTLYTSPFAASSRVTLTGLAIRCITAGSAGTTVRMGIYNNVSGRPGALLYEGTQDVPTVTAAADVIATTGLAVTLEPAVYWFAACFSGGPIMTSWGANLGGMAWYVGGSTAAEAFTSVSANRVIRTASLTYVAGSAFLPASFGAVSINTATPGSPVIGIVT